MKILFIVPYVPNLIRVRPYNLIRYLAARGHEITLLTLYTSPAERDDVKALRSFCREVYALPLPQWRSVANSLLALPTHLPLQAVYCWQPALSHLAQELTRRDGGFDLAHVEHLRGARYGLDLMKRNGGASGSSRRLPVVWDSVDCITLLFRQAAGQSRRLLSRWLTHFELGRTRRYEGWLTGQFDRVLVTSPHDRDELVGLTRGGALSAHVRVIPNGVDLEYYTPQNGDVPRDPATLVISGKMSYHANVTMAVTFVEEVLPLIWQRHPEVRLVIVGKDPTAEVRALGRPPVIEVTGTVADIRPYLHRATVAVAPIQYGAGIQNKVLEAMACGLPVVTTSRAVSALAVEAGREVLIADTPQEFAASVIRLLEDAAYREQVARAGRHYVEENHPWPKVIERLEEVYDEII